MTRGVGDRWSAAGAYETYMGRWSRLVASEFVGWLGAHPGGHWLELGSGTGALTATILARCAPATILACDQSAAFVAHVQESLVEPRVTSVVAAADALPRRAGGFDVVVSGLVLNFIAEPGAALAALFDRCRPGGVVAAYVWDYAGGVDLLRYFWEEAVAGDPGAAALDEARRFGGWQLPQVRSLFEAAGLEAVASDVLTVPTTFRTFDDYWTPFLGGTGPAPSYVASLGEARREALARRIGARLPRAQDGSIPLQARALAVRGVRP